LKKRVVVSVINDLVTDQRVNKVCNTLYETGFEVLLIGRRLPGSLPMDKRKYNTRRMHLIFKKGILFYAEFQIRLFIFLLTHKSGLLVSNDLDTLLPNYLISRIKRIPLVYDSHEYFTGVPELVNSPVKQKIWKTVERFIFPKLKDVFTVNDSIASLYEKEYGIRPKVVRNVPPLRRVKKQMSRKELNLPLDKKILILQGSGINIHRGAEEMVEAMQYIDNAILLIVGGGDVIDILKEKIKNKRLQNRVIIKGKQPYERLMQYTANADLGLSLDKNTNINYRYSLPNKIFDYLQAGIPVLVSNLVEIRKIVERYDVGDFIPGHNPRDIAAKVNEILGNQTLMERWRKNCTFAARQLNWENESKILMEVYNKYV
jgi:glycosyltransferase involved in cell wall biosynthesis